MKDKSQAEQAAADALAGAKNSPAIDDDGFLSTILDDFKNYEGAFYEGIGAWIASLEEEV